MNIYIDNIIYFDLPFELVGQATQSLANGRHLDENSLWNLYILKRTVNGTNAMKTTEMYTYKKILNRLQK